MAMKKLYLSFLWHMHQPYYKDDFQDQYLLPWVFLHGIKDYHEMPSCLANYPGVRAVFNFVPSLLVQLEDYAAGRARDPFLELIRMESDAMDQTQRSLLLPQLFMANAKQMIEPLARYRELYHRYQQLPSPDAAAQKFTGQDIIDLKVLFLLSWTGNSIRRSSSLIQGLLDQQRQFSEEQKNSLVTELLQRTGDIVNIYKDLLQRGQIEISATPFYHPILPLLLDPLSAREAKPDIAIPATTTPFPDDARWHVRQGIDYMQSIFGGDIAGMWPAEGSISGAAAELFCRQGVRWIASDEDVLFQSLGKDHNRSALYTPHRIQCDNGRTLTLFCRDKGLSDLIGFTYSAMEADRAAVDFMGRLRDIYDSCDFNPHVSVILDGENAWEFYPQNAAPFFNALYRKLENCDWIKTVTFAESLSHPELGYRPLAAIRAGSWIYGDFTTWMGHKEKNRAWELLARSWQAVAAKKDQIPGQQWSRILNELRIAQGSDWFWWYGDDHFSVQADIFDRIFRSHLINIYRLAEITIPPALYQPIKKTSRTGLLNSMSGYIHPKIDGRQSSFFEWMGAARFDLTCDMGSMHTDKRYLQTLFWGKDTKFLYFRLQGEVAALLNSDMVLQAEISSPDTHIIQYELDDPPGRITMDNNSLAGLECAAADYIEIQIPFAALAERPPDTINVQFTLIQQGAVVEQAPLYNAVTMDISNRFLDDWIV